MTSPANENGAKSEPRKPAAEEHAATPGSGGAATPQLAADQSPKQAVTRVSDLWHRIRERKLVQWALAYVGVSLGLLHGIELVGHPFHWPLIVTRIAIGLLIVGFFLALTFAWYHDEKGHQRFTQGETTIIALLLLVGSGMLIIFAKPDAEHESRTASTSTTTGHAEPATSAAKPSQLRLAVLPFENLSPAPENAFFADGMHEEILGTLATRATNLGVISRTTMMMYRATPKSVPEIAKELGVTHVLEGSVQREGQMVSVRLQLIDARIDRPVWAKHYDRQLVNAIALQSEVATEVTSQLSVELFANEKATPITTSPEAYDLYLKGKLAAQSVRPNATAEEFARIESLFNSAIELDPQFAAAHVERAWLRLLMRVYSLDLSDAHAERIRSDIAKAHDLGGATTSLLLVESRFALAVSRDRARALELVEAAESLGALSVNGLNIKAGLMRTAGRPDEAIALFSRAGDLDPANLDTFVNLRGLYWDLRRPAEALQLLRAFNERSRTKLPTGDVIFAFTGQTDELARDVGGLSPEIEVGQRLESQLHLARVQNRRTELVAIVDRSGVKELRQFGWSEHNVLALVGRKPVAELYGWAKLLNGDRAGAVSDGRTMLKFVERQTVNPQDDWYTHLLAAEGWLFSGENSRAVAETRVALTRTKPGTTFATRHVRGTAAMILAWAGEENDAVALLELLSTEFPGFGPAEITREPLYSIPLANNARYKSLERKLEAEIATNLKLPQ